MCGGDNNICGDENPICTGVYPVLGCMLWIASTCCDTSPRGNPIKGWEIIDQA